MKNKKLSINIIGKVPPPIGGVTIHTLRLYQWLKKDKQINVKLTALNKHSFKDKDIHYTGNFLFWTIKKLIFGFKEDVVHYQGGNYFGLFILYMIKILHPNFKLVFSVHSEYLINKIKKKFLFEKIIKNIDRIIADNPNIKKQLIKVNYNQDNIEIVSPFLMPSDYTENANNLLNKYKINNNKILLFNAYKLVFNDNGEDVYGLDTLLKAFTLLNSNNLILVLLIPSMNNDEKAYYNKLLAFVDERIKNNIILISDSKTYGWKYINSCDIFIRPTITDGDALSVKEALYMDIPTIVSNCTTRPNGVTLFNTSDANDLHNTINNIMQKKKQDNNLNKENNIVKFIEFYKALEGKYENTIS